MRKVGSGREGCGVKKGRDEGGFHVETSSLRCLMCVCVCVCACGLPFEFPRLVWRQKFFLSAKLVTAAHLCDLFIFRQCVCVCVVVCAYVCVYTYMCVPVIVCRTGCVVVDDEDDAWAKATTGLPRQMQVPHSCCRERQSQGPQPRSITSTGCRLFSSRS